MRVALKALSPVIKGRECLGETRFVIKFRQTEIPRILFYANCRWQDWVPILLCPDAPIDHNKRLAMAEPGFALAGKSGADGYRSLLY